MASLLLANGVDPLLLADGVDELLLASSGAGGTGSDPATLATSSTAVASLATSSTAVGSLATSAEAATLAIAP